MKPDPRDAYINRFQKRERVEAPPEVLKDLRFFRERVDAGRPISIAGLLEYLAKERGFKVGKMVLARIAREAKIDPWWSH